MVSAGRQALMLGHGLQIYKPIGQAVSWQHICPVLVSRGWESCIHRKLPYVAQGTRLARRPATSQMCWVFKRDLASTCCVRCAGDEAGTALSFSGGAASSEISSSDAYDSPTEVLQGINNLMLVMEER